MKKRFRPLFFFLRNRSSSRSAYGQRVWPLLCCLFLLMAPTQAFSKEISDFQRCLLQAMETADGALTLDEIRKQCRRKTGLPDHQDQQTTAEKERETGVIEQRILKDRENVLEPYSLMAHKPNYFLLASYNGSGVNEQPFRVQFADPAIETDDTEAKFQISLKTPLWVDLFKDRVDIFGAYTNRSFWQVYNKHASSPFRETNHEPEAWFQVYNDWEWMGFKNTVNAFGIVHQSNGRGGILSRSWNRLYANLIFQKDNLALCIKPWYRIPEADEDDDNPDITDYLGHCEIRSIYKWQDHTLSLMLRNNLESGFQRGAVELSWSFPLWRYPFFKGYIQYFNGYGESLIDYNQHSNSIGMGFLLIDWL